MSEDDIALAFAAAAAINPPKVKNATKARPSRAKPPTIESCKQCGETWERPAKSTAAYCSDKCRRQADLDQQTAWDRKFAAELREMQRPNVPPEVTELTVVTYHAHAVIWKVRGGSTFYSGDDPTRERTEAVLTIGTSLPSYVCDALAANLDLLPDEIVGLDPDPRKAIRLHQLALGDPVEWLANGNLFKDTIPDD